MRNIFRNIIIMAAMSAAAVSCEKEKAAVEEPYLYFGQNIEMMSFTQSGGSKTIEMYSNQGPWVIEPAYNDDLEWIDIWPNEGNNDGRFTITVSRNEEAYNRMTQINVVVDSKVIKSVNLYQLGTSPSILLDMGSARLSAPAKGGEVEVGIIANIGWQAVISEEGQSWITAGEQTDVMQKFTIAPNSGDEREAGIRFQAVGTGYEDVHVDFTIAQFDNAHDPYNGQKISLKDIYSSYSEGADIITDNLWCEGTVTSDISRLNFDPQQMFIQDGSGMGMRIDFNTAKDNDYQLGEHVKIHLYGLSVNKDGDTGALSISGTSSNAVFERNAGTEVTPAEITDLSTLDDWQNTLVTVKNVSFALPFGTYLNVDDRYYNATGTNFNPYAVPFCDGNDFAGQLIVDSKGNQARVYVRSTFLDRHASIMQKGCGDMTGIVQRYHKAGMTENTLLIRSNDDNKVSDNADDCLYSTIVRFGPFDEGSEMEKLTPYVGKGQFKQSVFEKVGALGTAGGVAMDWGWSYMRKAPATITVAANGKQTASPSIPNTNAGNPGVMYSCISCQKFWDATGSTINRSGGGTDDYGEAWIFNIEDFNAEAGKPLYLVFTSSASQTGPMYFDIEWHENEGAAINEYRKIGEFINPDWYTSHQLEQFRFRLPDELAGLRNFTIRFRVSKNWRAGNGMTNGKESATSIASGGAPRIGIWSIEQSKQ
ncbi:MAG: DUF5689 domain-containing protein [Bacteroidales bacterium]|nr:DUF5689 domain-containing protein [Bacteroidales bacterium]